MKRFHKRQFANDTETFPLASRNFRPAGFISGVPLKLWVAHVVGRANIQATERSSDGDACGGTFTSPPSSYSDSRSALTPSRTASPRETPDGRRPRSGLNRAVLYPSVNRADEIPRASRISAGLRATGVSQRNRILAGLSDAVLVIEAEQKRGYPQSSRRSATAMSSPFTFFTVRRPHAPQTGAPITSANDP